jgi:adenosylhomocysteine nucleosidase
MSIAIGIITALERELHPLIDAKAGGWTRTDLARGSRSLICYESGDRVAVAGGIGCNQAEAAARAVVEKYRPRILISAGLAGALIPSLKVGSIVTPNVIVDAATGAEYRCKTTSATETLRHEENGASRTGEGTSTPARATPVRSGDPGACVTRPCRLVSTNEVAGAQSKADLAERFQALTVDMEAAGVARVAQECNLGFLCVKAISDESDFPMPPLNRFVDREGNFKTGSFAAWTALRPQHWSRVLELSRNSALALRALAGWLAQNASGCLDAGAVTLECVP